MEQKHFFYPLSIVNNIKYDRVIAVIVVVVLLLVIVIVNADVVVPFIVFDLSTIQIARQTIQISIENF